MSAITPTVGRKVWFYADGLQKDPHDATIVKVYGSGPNAAVSESLKLVTICVLILRNGHRIVGVNEGPVSAANFDAKFGRKLAREKATDQIWPLLGYELRSQLSKAGQ